MGEVGRLLAIAWVFVPLSFLSLGGGTAIFAEMQRQSVEINGWLTNREFVELFAISRAAPGPGSLICALVGWKAAGFAGALVAALALYLPSSFMLYAAGLWWHRGGQARLRYAIEVGLRPVAVGLIFAGGWRVLEADGGGWLRGGTALAVTGVMLVVANPYLVLVLVAASWGGLAWAGLA